MGDYPVIKSEVDAIRDVKLRLAALIDLEERCTIKLRQYIKDAQDDIFNPVRYFDTDGNPLDTLEKFNDSWDSVYIVSMGTVFSLRFKELKDDIRQLKEIVEIRKKYPQRKKIVSSKKSDSPTDLRKAFLNLFRDPQKGEQVIRILMTRDYIDDHENWKGLSGHKTELTAAYNVWDELNLLKPHKVTPTVILIYKRFGLPIPGYVSDRALRSKTPHEDAQEFRTIFEPLKTKN